MKKLLLLPVLLTVSLLAQTFNVSTTPELRTALTNAATNGEDDTIILADGTYKTTDDGQGTFIYLSNEANSLTLQGSSRENVILSGDSQHQILNHKSTSISAHLILYKLSFVDGYTTEFGGGVIAERSIEVSECKFMNNIASQGGGFRAVVTTVSNSVFTNNSASYGGGFRAGTSDTIVKNSTFVGNSASSSGGGFYTNSNVTVDNSIFTANTASAGGAFHASNTKLLNSLFVNNSNALYLYADSTILNNIFANNSNYAVDMNIDAILYANNNYINPSKIITQYVFNLNNIYNNVTLGFTDEANGNYRLTSSSDLIDAGTTTIEGLTFPTTDLDGNARIVGGSIDIGPYEFSTTRPTINSISYTGVAKEQSLLTFSVDYTLASGRAINTIEYDYANNGSWSTASTHTFNTAGTYTVNVKITDSEGEFSTTSKVVTIAALAFSDMTDEQKLIKAIDPVYYDAVVAIIETQKESANVSGYELGTYDGTQLVIAAPDAYGLDVVIPLQVAEVNALPTGWSMMAVPAAITDMSIFSSVKVVWYFKDDVWRAYSPNAATTSALAVAGIATLTTLPANSAVWVEK
jgi:hypothetical protein